MPYSIHEFTEINAISLRRNGRTTVPHISASGWEYILNYLRPRITAGAVITWVHGGHVGWRF